MAATLTPIKRDPAIVSGCRIAWTDPGGIAHTGEVLAAGAAGPLVRWDDGPSKRIPWDATDLRLIETEAAPEVAPMESLVESESPVDPAGDPPAPTEYSTGNIAAPAADAPQVLYLDPATISPFGLQPRTEFNAEEIQVLADSIQRRGQDTPIAVRPAHPRLGTEWEIIYGERRWRACRLAGKPVLAINRGPVSDDDALDMATEENAHRADLQPLEVARNIQYLTSRGRTQERIAELLGRSQGWVSQTGRLTCLPGPAQELVRTGALTRGHGVALLRFLKAPKALNRIAALAAERAVSVRALEAEVPFEFELRQEGLLGLLKPPALDLDERPKPQPATVTTRETTETTTTVASAPPPAAPDPPAAEAPAAPVTASAPAPDPGPRAEAPATAPEPPQSVPATGGAIQPDAPLMVCMVPADAVEWIKAGEMTAGQFLTRIKAAAYYRGVNAVELLTDLETI